MTIDHRIIEGPLPPADAWHPAGAGAVVTFEGVVRPTEEGHALQGIEYEIYEPMTSRQMHRLAADVFNRFGLVALHVEHSVGYVAVGACSFRLRTAAPHRKEALAAQDAYIDRMKRDVPIWKHPVWQNAPRSRLAEPAKGVS
jgi:molybdopterin synthase catalytic subunit